MVNNRKPLEKVLTEHELEDNQQALASRGEPQRSCEASNEAQTTPGNSGSSDVTVTITVPSRGTDAEHDLQSHSSWKPEDSALTFGREIQCGLCFTESLLIQSLMCGCLIEAKSMHVSWLQGVLGKLFLASV